MRHVEIKQAAQALFSENGSPFGDFSIGSDTHQAVTIPDAVRRCRWIAVDIAASAFGLFFLGPASERSRLVPCFDSDYPAVGACTRSLSDTCAEEIARHARASTEPRWWADDAVPGAAAAFHALVWGRRIAPLVPGASGVVFPVHAERGQCGLVVFFNPGAALTDDMLCDIHARCFSLFGAVARIRPGENGHARAMSKRELECLKLTANGYTSEEIARLLKLSVHTANQYLTQSVQKLNAVSRTQAVAKALRLGLIE